MSQFIRHLRFGEGCFISLPNENIYSGSEIVPLRDKESSSGRSRLRSPW